MTAGTAISVGHFEHQNYLLFSCLVSSVNWLMGLSGVHEGRLSRDPHPVFLQDTKLSVCHIMLVACCCTWLRKITAVYTGLHETVPQTYLALTPTQPPTPSYALNCSSYMNSFSCCVTLLNTVKCATDLLYNFQRKVLKVGKVTLPVRKVCLIQCYV